MFGFFEKCFMMKCMITLKNTDLNDMEKRYRVNFVNSLSGCKSAYLIGTQHSDGTPNLAVFSSVFHLGADPALMGMVSRPNTVPRHTLENIQSTRVFTLNHVSESFYKKAHLTSARTRRSEFELSGLTEVYQDKFLAPFVKESRLQIGLSYVRTIDIEENGTHIIVGKIVSVSVPEEAIQASGDIDMTSLQSVGVTGLNTYHKIQFLGSLPYAKDF